MVVVAMDEDRALVPSTTPPLARRRRRDRARRSGDVRLRDVRTRTVLRLRIGQPETGWARLRRAVLPLPGRAR